MILLPPSEGKTEGGGRATVSMKGFSGLAEGRVAVRDAVRCVLAGGETTAQKLLGVNGANLERALREWHELDEAPTMPAAQRYSGVVWAALSPETLDPLGRRRLNRRVLVPSGLWGLVAANDLIPAYRLKMGARVPPVGGLAAFWRPHITPLIAARAGKGWVIDLLPAEHAAAIDFTRLGAARRLKVEITDDGGRVVGHAGKTLKGRLARAIIDQNATDPVGVAGVSVAGLRADGVEKADPSGAVTVRFVTVAGQRSETIH